MTSEAEHTPETQEPTSNEESIAQRSARLEAEAASIGSAENNQEEPQTEEDIAEALYGDDNENAEIYSAAQSEGIIKALQDELDKAKDQTARALAEAENTRRRAQKEREDASKFSISSFAKDLLDVSDNMRRALEAVPTDLLDTEPRLKNLVDGIEATERTLLRTFEKHGIEKIEPMDEPFNPNFHEVMFEAPVPGKPGGLVMQVMEPGYVLNERLLRAAKVGVTKDDGTGQNEPPPSGGHLDTEA